MADRSLHEFNFDVMSTGDMAVMSRRYVIVAEQLCEALDLRAGWSVLEVGCGTGLGAIAAARRSCKAVGTDFVEKLVEAARERAAFEKLEATFEVMDMEALRFPDASFDAVISIFAAPFTVDHARAADEMLRVLRPGGRIGSIMYTPESMPGCMAATIARHAPPPEGIPSPFGWGTPRRLHDLLAGRAYAASMIEREWILRAPTPAAVVDGLLTFHPPSAAAYQRVDAAGRARMRAHLMEDLGRWNRSSDQCCA